MAPQQQLPPRDLPPLPYFTLDMHRRAGGDAVELLLTGDLDDLTVGHLDDSLGWVVEHMTQPQVVVDLTGVTRLGRAAVESLLRTEQRLLVDGRTLAVRGDSVVVRRSLAEAGRPDLLAPVDGGNG